ncbi:MAG: 30S ribosomal protein S20 [Paracoccaceae bacterium]|nr:30S ribosomal protein S20 [Paracoccaceae bacterium]MDE2675733.1 30S ribosomal protein S20 [Paracoccaceae bacterium]MDE2738624.1 30S ribosomal protein S20 [Paracoccaceae bacterium]MXZ49242.1 30S ribosomal protein S20 [Paracoccaceae bacterium]MYF45670.1 30S ribosomal protein S20 [Paracoccaceae bacterium]
MANSRQAKKRARQSVVRFKVNHSRIMRVRTFIRKVEEAVAGGNYEEARSALRQAQSEIMRSVSKGIMHKNTASRKVSRLSRKVKLLAA